MPQSSVSSPTRPTTLAELRADGWTSRSVKEELRSNLIAALESDRPLFPGVLGYDDTVIPEIVLGVLSGHDLLFLGEKGQAKSRLMRALPRFLDEWIPYLDIEGSPVHEDPEAPITGAGRALVASRPPEEVPIAWWHRDDRYAERLAPGTKFADVIGEIDPARVVAGASLGDEESIHFGLVPRMHRGIFAMNELPDLDELVQTGLFNILEERDVQIRGYPVSFDLDLLLLFSANPATFNRSGKVIPQLKDRIGSTIRTHYPRDRGMGVEIVRQEAGLDLDGAYPVQVPPFMDAIVEEVSIRARASSYVDQESGVSARFSVANWRAMVSSARRRGIALRERPAVPRISDLSHLRATAMGKLELDLMGSHQLDEGQALDAILAEAIAVVFDELVDEGGLAVITEAFGAGVRIEVGDLVPSESYETLMSRIPEVWTKALEVNHASSPAVRASCCEFLLAGLHATNRISRSERFGRTIYESLS